MQKRKGKRKEFVDPEHNSARLAARVDNELMLKQTSVRFVDKSTGLETEPPKFRE
jgi:hypothetical protein